jgi:hypothetical protein
MPESDRDHLLRRVREILERHQGPDEAITMTQLHVTATGETIIPWKRYDQTRLTRSLIDQLRREGMPIASCGRGYYVARSGDELEATIARFHSRALSSLKAEATLKRMHPGELIRQYSIELQAPEESST